MNGITVFLKNNNNYYYYYYYYYYCYYYFSFVINDLRSTVCTPVAHYLSYIKSLNYRDSSVRLLHKLKPP